MSLIELEAGTEAKVQPLNDNFTYLETQITNVGDTVSSQASQISTLSTSVSTLNTSVSGINTTLTSKANTNGDNITEAFATKLVNSYGDKLRGHPNYSAGESKSGETEYTTTADGWLCIQITGQQSSGCLYIDDIEVATFYHDDDENRGAHWRGIIPIAKGSTYKAHKKSGNSAGLYLVFYPCK